MVKKIAIACLCMALGSSLNAREMSESETFIGLEVGYTEVEGDRIGLLDNTDEDVSYGFRIGAQSGEWRTMFLFNYYDNSDTDQNVAQGLFTVDYFLLDPKSSSESTFRPYIGANVGYASYESTFIDDSGFLYGGQLGFVVDVAETVDLDFAYRYSFSDADTLDHIGSFVFGIHYLY